MTFLEDTLDEFSESSIEKAVHERVDNVIQEVQPPEREDCANGLFRCHFKEVSIFENKDVDYEINDHCDVKHRGDNKHHHGPVDNLSLSVILHPSRRWRP